MKRTKGEEFILIFSSPSPIFPSEQIKNTPGKNFHFPLHILPNFREISLSHTVKYKNHSVGYIFHSVGYKSRSVKQRILQNKKKYATRHLNFISGAAESIRQKSKKNPESRPLCRCRLSGFPHRRQRNAFSNYITASAINWINRIRNTMAMGYTVA